MDDNTIVCRCEDITLGEIHDMIKSGVTDMNLIKRLTRCGMGPCQGKTCRPLLMNEIVKNTSMKVEQVKISTVRPLTKPVLINELLNGDIDK